MIRIGFFTIFFLFCVLSLVAYESSRPIFDESLLEPPASAFALAPKAKALTFARTLEGQVLLVTELNRASVTGIDLGLTLKAPVQDAIDALTQFSEEQLRSMDLQASDSTSVTASWQSLDLPISTNYPHIATGTNYKSQALEVGLEEEPFLFPKLTRATRWNGNVPKRTRLDYEAELCAVPITAYRMQQPARLGFILCSDYTDRAALVAQIDLDGPMGVTGFADGKGGSGMLSVGSLLVVPVSHQRFYSNLELGLTVNGALRQRSKAGLMIWSPDEIAALAVQQCSTEFISLSAIHRITPCAAISPGTLILTGTPEGVLFDLTSLWSPWAYLQAGDQVITYATHLGMLNNTVGSRSGT
jgi:2-keto-4-pentenoate hydratase/2-oxohepta-3-ene-1,7-dioic acid hydratase in catechol pathway